MTVSLSPTASLMLAVSTTGASVNSLAKAATGEHAAASVDAVDAGKRGPVNDTDGRHGTPAPSWVEPSSAPPSISSGTQAALTGLVLGGA